MTKKPQKKQVHSNSLLIIIPAFAIIGVLALIIVRAAGPGFSVGSGAKLSGAVVYKSDDSKADGNYLSFGVSGSSGYGDVLPAGQLPAYPPVPAVNGSTVKRAKNYSEMMAAVKDPSVRVVVLADGNYVHPNKEYVSINAVEDKLIVAENKHGARIEHAQYWDFDGMHITNTKNVTIRGLVFSKPRDYAIKMGGQDYSPTGPNHGTTIEFVKITDSGRGGFNVNSGFGSSCSPGGEGTSTDITIRYNEFFKLGMKHGSDPLPGNAGLSEGIYTGSGGSCQVKDTADGIHIHNNNFDGTGQISGGEAIGAKTHTRNLLIENNSVKNWNMHQNTDGAVISAWIDVGQPPDTQATATAGKDGIVIRGNYIENVQNHSSASTSKARGIMVGHAATIENNTIKNTAGAAIGVTLHGYTDKLIWGFSNGKEATVNIRNNTTSNNGRGVLDHDYSKANFPITINYGGNSPELTPFSISNVRFNKQ